MSSFWGVFGLGMQRALRAGPIRREIRRSRSLLQYLTVHLSMSAHRVVVTYSAPQSFLSSDQWKQLRDALSAQLPLRNIHWKPQTLPSIRTIQELEVQLVPLNTVRDENASQVPYSLLERPLLNIYVVTCEVRLHASLRPKVYAFLNRTATHIRLRPKNRSKTGKRP
jgi:hypothetical protein